MTEASPVKAIMAAALAISALACPATAQVAPQAKGDPREAVALSPAETETMLAGMRTYLETIQGIVAAMAENQVARVPEIAARSGAKLLQVAEPATGLKLPLGFTSMSFDTHDKFDKLADKARKGASRSEVLNDLRDIMGNCISCHAAYRLAK
jgi:cytochrome c556